MMEAIMMFKASEVLGGRYDNANLDELFKAVSDNYIVDEEQYILLLNIGEVLSHG